MLLSAMSFALITDRVLHDARLHCLSCLCYPGSDQKWEKVLKGGGAEAQGEVKYSKLQIGFHWVSGEPHRGGERVRRSN